MRLEHDGDASNGRDAAMCSPRWVMRRASSALAATTSARPPRDR
jgi:hypothetical protein